MNQIVIFAPNGTRNNLYLTNTTKLWKKNNFYPQ